MTNDQNLVYLIHQTEELLKALDKTEQPGSGIIHREDVKKKRLALKIWLINNKMVAPSAPVARQQRKQTNGKFNWYAQ